MNTTILNLRYKSVIVNDIIFKHFISYCVVQYYVECWLQKNCKKQACSLLKLLPLKGIHGINQFLNYLSTYYSWIADPLLRDITNKYNGMFSTKLRDILITGEVPQLSSRHVSRVEHVCVVYILVFS